jgi:surface carbohydrate biosynthesis protein
MIDILFLELPANDRDLNLMIPVYLYLKKSGYNVVIENLNYSTFYVLKYRPKLIIFSNPHDSTVYEIKKRLFGSGVTIITLTTEGNYQEIGFHGYFWGWNIEHKLHQHALLLWNSKSKRLIAKFHPEFEPKLFVTGSIGHDRYVNANKSFLKKNAFLNSEKLSKYTKIIGIAGFGLFKYVDDPSSYEIVDPLYPKSNLELFKIDRIKLKEYYKNLILKYQDTLFILRMHPETTNALGQTEFCGLENYPNVFFSAINRSLPKIDDVINISDLWIAYETNTSIEAWLLKKPVIYFNPTTFDFQRENHFGGCLQACSIDQVYNWIEEFYLKGSIKEYEEKSGIRVAILNEVVEYLDGNNYKRAGMIIKDLYSALPQTKRNSYLHFLRHTKFIDLLRAFLHTKNWYWYIRKDLVRPDYLSKGYKTFGEKYLNLYADIVEA